MLSYRRAIFGLVVFIMLLFFLSHTWSALAQISTQGNICNSQFTEPLTQTFYIYLPIMVNTINCYDWEGQIPLQLAVDQFSCVEIQPGIWTTTAQISMPANHMLVGTDRDNTTLQAVAPWIGNSVANDKEAVVHNNGNANVRIANFTIDANTQSTFGVGAGGMTINSMRIMNAKCDGIAINSTGMIVQNSLVENNGKQCTITNLPGSGIYITQLSNDHTIADYSPVLTGNIIRYNGGPALDVDRVWGGTFKGNTVYENQAWAAISLYSASHWVIKDNTIRHPSATVPSNHPRHGRCDGGPFGTHPAALSLCQDTGMADEIVTSNMISNNQISGWYGILAIGNDEENTSWVPSFNIFQENDVYGSIVGCADDFEPNLNSHGANVWTNNNCAGKPDTLPLYFMILCPSAVRRNKIQDWNIGEADVPTVDEYVRRFNAERTGGGDFKAGDRIPAGVIIATSFDVKGYTWNQFPVKPIVNHQGYGLFETMNSYNAPYTGACLSIVP